MQKRQVFPILLFLIPALLKGGFSEAKLKTGFGIFGSIFRFLFKGIFGAITTVVGGLVGGVSSLLNGLLGGVKSGLLRPLTGAAAGGISTLKHGVGSFVGKKSLIGKIL